MLITVGRVGALLVLAACSGQIEGGFDLSLGGGPGQPGQDGEPVIGPDGKPIIGPDGKPITNPNEGPDNMGPGGGPSEVIGADGNPIDCTVDRAAFAPMRRLTAAQYKNSVEIVFEGKLSASEQFPTSTTGISISGFSTDPESTAVTQLDAEQIMLAAEDTAVEVAEHLGDYLECYPASQNRACAESFIDLYAERALRRPPTDDERQLLLESFDDASADGFDVGIAAITQTLLQMPAFLYLVETGGGDAPEDGSVVMLTDYELAARLSYLFWEASPDDELLALARDGALADPDTLRGQAERMLDDPRAAGAVSRFYREWSQIRRYVGGEKELPEFTALVAQSMQDSFDKFVYDATLGPDATLERLLTRSDIPVDATLASFLNLDRSADDNTELVPVERPVEQAAGILSHPALVTGLAHEAKTSPVFRGKFVRTQLLCGVLGSPPPDAQGRQPEYPPNATERDKAEALAAVQECGGCHVQMNPIGVAFEEYDPIGRFRAVYEDGQALDNSGRIEGGGDAEGDFDGVHGLGERLGQSDQVRSCMTRQWLRFTFSRQDDEADTCALAAMDAQFASNDYSMRDLLLSITATPEFRQRRMPAEEAP